MSKRATTGKPKKKREAADEADARLPHGEEIDAHELLDADQRVICRSFRDLARRNGEPFTMHDFAGIALRATARDFVEADDAEILQADRKHLKAAVLYVYEMIRTLDASSATQWPGHDQMLRCLVEISQGV